MWPDDAAADLARVALAGRFQAVSRPRGSLIGPCCGCAYAAATSSSRLDVRVVSTGTPGPIVWVSVIDFM